MLNQYHKQELNAHLLIRASIPNVKNTGINDTLTLRLIYLLRNLALAAQGPNEEDTFSFCHCYERYISPHEQPTRWDNQSP